MQQKSSKSDRGNAWAFYRRGGTLKNGFPVHVLGLTIHPTNRCSGVRRSNGRTPKSALRFTGLIVSHLSKDE